MAKKKSDEKKKSDGKNKKTVSKSKDSASHDPALIPVSVYGDEHRRAVSGAKTLFINRATLDRSLSISLKHDLVERVDALAAGINQTRTELVNSLNSQQHSFVGKGFRNYGFMMASNQSINNFPELAPAFIEIDDFNSTVEDYLFMRDISERILTISGDARDIMNILGNLSYSFALAYYDGVRSIASRTHNKTATGVLAILQRFFTRGRTPGAKQNEMEVEHHLRALMHGTRDGEITVRNESPHSEGGMHEVTDDSHKPQEGSFRATVHGTVCSECGRENETGAKFCVECGTKLNAGK